MNYIYKDGELYHYGVKGMKWGVRRANKWANAKTQPSSLKSSVLAGLYAATGSKRVGKALDKSNDRDAERWERAKAEILNNPADKNRREQSKQRKTHQSEINEIVQAKGATKAVKILKKIGNVATSKIPKSPQPWDEKPDRNYRGGRI